MGATTAAIQLVDAMKMLPLPPKRPSKITWSQAGLDVLWPLLAIALFVLGLWAMPIGLFVGSYSSFLSAGFLAAFVKHYTGIRREKGLRIPFKRTPYWSRDSFKPLGAPRELHLAMMTRSVKEHHRPSTPSRPTSQNEIDVQRSNTAYFSA